MCKLLDYVWAASGKIYHSIVVERYLFMLYMMSHCFIVTSVVLPWSFDSLHIEIEICYRPTTSNQSTFQSERGKETTLISVNSVYTICFVFKTIVAWLHLLHMCLREESASLSVQIELRTLLFRKSLMYSVKKKHLAFQSARPSDS
jgi:hypothetical protein